MPSGTKAKPRPGEPSYVGWRGELVARLTLARAGLAVQDAPTGGPFDLLASTEDGVYFLVEVKAYSSMHGGMGGEGDGRWPVEAELVRAAGEANVPAVLFVVDADREVGYWARLDGVAEGGGRRAFVRLTGERDLSAEGLAGLVEDLRTEREAKRRPA